jgi:transketolase
MRNAYLAALYELAKGNKNIMALVSDNGAIVYDHYRKDFPGQFLNFGISEANMISVAAGMACCGKIPFAYTIASFLTMRPFEQIRNDVCLQKMNVKLVGIGGGFVYGNLGPTHHAVEDIALMRSLPNMTVFAPADPLESKKVTCAAAEISGPVYIRLSIGGTPKIYNDDYDFVPGRAVTLREGSDIAIISSGGILFEVLEAYEALKALGISAMVINMHTIKPIDKEAILNAARHASVVLTVEEHLISGGLGSAVAEVLTEDWQMPVIFKRLGLNNTFPQGYGTYEEMKENNGLSKNDIVAAAVSMYEKKRTLRKI